MAAYLNLVLFRSCQWFLIHLAPCVSSVSFLLCLEQLLSNFICWWPASFAALDLSERAALKGREKAKFLLCNAASEKGMTFLKTSSLLLWSTSPELFPSWPCFPSFLFCVALTGCASVNPNPVTNSSLATSHLSPLHQYAQRCPSAGKWNNVNKKCSASFSALFCSGLGMWRYQMGPGIWLYSGLLLSTLHFTE